MPGSQSKPPSANDEERLGALREKAIALSRAGAPLAAMIAEKRSVSCARAPGRLDVMGGISDYSGSLVLEMPISEATYALAQRSDDGAVWVASMNRSTGTVRQLRVPLSMLASEGYPHLRQTLSSRPEEQWAAYPLGAIVMLLQEKSARPSGMRVLLESDVPEGKGVSSSAALEIATMLAVSAECGLTLDPMELATLSQRAENLIVGAPCGIMDQVTCTLGQQGRLLALECQPANLQGFVDIPSDIEFIGVDSGVRHAVTGADYGQVRTAAFMGRAIIGKERCRGYLANLNPHEFEGLQELLPERITGAEFLKAFDETGDPITRVDPSRSYPVRAATAHPVYENFRVHEFARLLKSPMDLSTKVALGNLMVASHLSYSACGLGSKATDELVQLALEEGPERGIYGAKITGGGSGGTVVLLTEQGATSPVNRLLERFAKARGYEPFIFRGSSMGAAAFGVRTLPSQ